MSASVPESPRIRFIGCSERLLIAAMESDLRLSKELNAVVPGKWGESAKDIFEPALEMIREEPSCSRWLLYFPVVVSLNLLAGSCGYKGVPRDGTVEIGFETSPLLRRRGYAKEMAEALIRYAFSDDGIDSVTAHVLKTNLPSKRVLAGCGMSSQSEFPSGQEVEEIWSIERI
jgi:RimJ/RimL family protein N-acetyltransferase